MVGIRLAHNKVCIGECVTPEGDNNANGSVLEGAWRAGWDRANARSWSKARTFHGRGYWRRRRLTCMDGSTVGGL